MAGQIPIILVAFALAISASGAGPLPRWEIVELRLPTDSPSAAIDVNERNEVIGRRGAQGAEVGFISSAGELKVLEGFGGGRTLPRTINNSGMVVGSSLSNGVMCAWAWSNGINLDLSIDPSRASVASAINDLGEIIGTVEEPNWYPTVYRFSAPVARLTPEVILSVNGSDPPRAGGVHGVNNDGVVVGQYFGQGFIVTNWTELTWPKSLRAADRGRPESAGLALNSINQVAGFVRTQTTVKQPAVWTNDHWEVLPSSLEWDTQANGINDSGMIVGTMASWPTAMIWKDGAGADLNGFVTLAEQSRLVGAVAINNAGYIAANLSQREVVRAVLLKPVSAGAIPKLELAGPDGRVLHTNKIDVSVTTDYVGTAARTVTYRLYERLHHHGFDGFSEVTTYHTELVQMTLAGGESTPVTFEDLQPGAYFLTAELNDTNGVSLYSKPISFVVTQAPRLRAYRVSSEGVFNFSMSPTPGQEFELQESTDLVTWTRVNGWPVSGGGFGPQADGPARFYRTVAVRKGLDIDSREEAYMEQAPAQISGRGAELYLFEPFSATISLATNGVFVARNNRRIVIWEGNYTYKASGYEASLILEDPVRQMTAQLTLEFPMVIPIPMAAYFPRARGTMSRYGEVVPVKGFLTTLD